MALPIVTAVLGLVISLSAIGLLGHALEVPSVGATLATMIGLGVGIDYAIRHKVDTPPALEGKVAYGGRLNAQRALGAIGSLAD